MHSILFLIVLSLSQPPEAKSDFRTDDWEFQGNVSIEAAGIVIRTTPDSLSIAKRKVPVTHGFELHLEISSKTPRGKGTVSIFGRGPLVDYAIPVGSTMLHCTAEIHEATFSYKIRENGQIKESGQIRGRERISELFIQIEAIGGADLMISRFSLSKTKK